MDETLLQSFIEANGLSLSDVNSMYRRLKIQEDERRYDKFIAEYKKYIGCCFVIKYDFDDDEQYVKIIGVDKSDYKFVGYCCYDSYWFTRTSIGIEEYEPFWETKITLEQLKQGREIAADEYASIVRKVLGEFLANDWAEEVKNDF